MGRGLAASLDPSLSVEGCPLPTPHFLPAGSIKPSGSVSDHLMRHLAHCFILTQSRTRSSQVKIPDHKRKTLLE